MNVKTIKFLDKWIGGIICKLLTMHDTFYKSLRLIGQHKEKKTEKLIFIKLIEQGATVIAYSSIVKATQMVGREHVYFLVFNENKPILELLDIIPIENIITIRQDNILLFISDLLSALRKIKRLKVDTTIDMEFFSRASAIISYLTFARKRIGFHRFTCEYPYRGDLMTHKVQYNPYIHTAIAYQLLVEAIDTNISITPMPKISLSDIKLNSPLFTASEIDKKRVLGIIRNEFGDSTYSKIILLNPNASDMLPIRKWDSGNFITLAHLLNGYYKEVLIILTGAPSEQASAEIIHKQINLPNAISLAGKTKLRDLFVLYTLSDLLVTNDSGPGHFSSVTNINSLVLFGPETPTLFGPLGKNSHTIHTSLACSPCVNAFNHRFSPCNNNVCMQSITPEIVFEKIKEILPLDTFSLLPNHAN
ncbi:MAG: glycosyltransferase family 9 protein [Bacteroidota bacterium]